MSIVFEEVVGQVEAAPPTPATEERDAPPKPPRSPERDRVRAAVCRERRRAARLEAD